MKNNNGNVIEVLHTEDCAFWREVAKTIREVLEESKIKALVKRVKVSSEDEAKKAEVFRFARLG